MAPEKITSETLQDYLDDRLSDRRRAEVARYLQGNPSIAAEIEMQRFQDDGLRALAADVLEEPVPERLRSVVTDAAARSAAAHSAAGAAAGSASELQTSRRTSASRLVEIAAVLFVFVLGGAIGWLGHGQLYRGGPSEVDVVISEAAFAFSALSENGHGILDFGPDQDAEFAEFATQFFHRPLNRPQLDAVGLQYRGARILPSARRLVSYFLFQTDRGDRISVTVWPSSLPANPTVRASTLDDVRTRFWLQDKVGFAVMGQAEDAFMERVTQEVFQYYAAASAN